MAGQRKGRTDPDAVAARRRRAWLPIVIAAAMGLVLTLVVTGPGTKKTPKEGMKAPGTAAREVASTTDAQPEAEGSPEAGTTQTSAPEASDSEAGNPETPEADNPEAGTTQTSAPEAGTPDPPLDEATAAAESTADGLRVRLIDVSPDAPPLPTLGGLINVESDNMQLSFTQLGGGISEIVFSDIWTSARAKRQAAAHRRGLAAGNTKAPPLPPESERYVLASEQLLPVGGGRLATFPILACRSITVNGLELNLAAPQYWTPSGPGVFKATIENTDGNAVLDIERSFTLDGWSIYMEQRLRSHATDTLDVSWSQYGPPGLSLDRGSYMDRRRFRFGYLLGDTKDPDRLAGVMSDGALKVEFSEAIDEETTSTMWPNPLAEEEGFELSWFGASSRYFGLVVYPPKAEEGPDHLSLTHEIERITRIFDEVDGTSRIATVMFSPTRHLAPGDTIESSLATFAGPLKRSLLEETQPYSTLRLGGLVLYRMSDFCAFCTFQWLAVWLVQLLSFFDNWVVFDWGVSIILLVICVRTLLHPVTKRSQMGMQIFSKKMSKLKPEMDRIHKKFADDKKRAQQEQMRLFREHGVNPLQMLGCLPLFLQTPIWIALWAALYFAFDLRQESAFYGVFQLFGSWQFLGDLAQPDHCFWTFEHPIKVLIFDVTGINLLPFLLGGIFWVQQKYLTPKSMTMTPEQASQQKIMRIMMVVLFPIMLYSAPSGLLLYIITSSAVGITESRYIRKKVDSMDLTQLAPSKSAPTKRGQDAEGKAYQKMLSRRAQDAKRKQGGGDRSFKKRK